MNRPVRFVAAFGLASVVLLALSAAVAQDWRPVASRPRLNPVAEEPLPTASPLAVVETATTVPPEPGRRADPASAAWVVQPSTAAAGGWPGIVLIHGAGPGSRDGLLAEARALAAAGMAAIVYDKRAGLSTVWHRDFGILAADALRAGEVLGRMPGVDPSRIGLMGWSEGGWVAAEAARQNPDRIAFVGLASTPVVSPAAQLHWMARRAAPGMPAWVEKTAATMLGAGRWLQPWIGYESGPGLAALDVPVIAFWGQDDPLVPVNEALSTVRNQVPGPVSLHVIPGAGHHLPIHTGYLERAAAWLSATPRSASTDSAVRGVEPTSDLGVGRLPDPSWVGHPVGHVVVSLIVATLAVALRRRPRLVRRHPSARPVLEGTP